ncbi:MAG: hypothetical protein ACFBWO_08155 [Paracoccaceae bacterium]
MRASLENGLLILEASGQVTAADFEAVVHALIAGRLDPIPRRWLVVYDPFARLDALTLDRLRTLHRRLKAIGFPDEHDAPARVALVARVPEHVGHARFCRSLWISETATIEAIVTGDEAEGRAWLRGDGSDHAPRYAS